MRTGMLISVAMSMLMAGCAARPHADSAAGAAVESTHPVIVHIVSRSQTITIRSSPGGLLYSLKDASGKVMVADATASKFAELEPELYGHIRHSIAVHADDAPIPAAGDVLVPIAIDNAVPQ